MKSYYYKKINPHVDMEIELWAKDFSISLLNSLVTKNINENINLSTALGGALDPSTLGPRIESALGELAARVRQAGNTQVGKMIGDVWLDTIKVDINNIIADTLQIPGLKSNQPGGQIMSQAMADIDLAEWGEIADDWTGYGCTRVSDAIVKGIAMAGTQRGSAAFQQYLQGVPVIRDVAKLFGSETRLSRMARQYGVRRALDTEEALEKKELLSNYLCNEVGNEIRDMSVDDAKEQLLSIIAVITGSEAIENIQ
jgi:hypothetical protein